MTKEEISKLDDREQSFIYENHLESFPHEEIEEIAKCYDYLVWIGVL